MSIHGYFLLGGLLQVGCEVFLFLREFAVGLGHALDNGMKFFDLLGGLNGLDTGLFRFGFAQLIEAVLQYSHPCLPGLQHTCGFISPQ